MKFRCRICGKSYPLDGLAYRCECGGLFELEKEQGEKIPYIISLGESETPLLERQLGGVNMTLKLDYMMPTGSFKDRGAFAMINKLKELGIGEVVEDSSGNAGAAIAGYCAAAGIKCSIYLPDATSEGKIKQIRAYGAEIKKIRGSRDDVSETVMEAAKKTYYASHVYNPLFFEGTKSFALEAADRMGIPDYAVVPAGNGTMLLGAYIGFKEAGKLPKIIAVQSMNCDPVHRKFKGLRQASPSPTATEGIAVGKPARIDEMISAVRESGGDFITVSDAEVLSARDSLARTGIYCEATAGAAVAGAVKYFKDSAEEFKILVPLTGSGLKK